MNASVDARTRVILSFTMVDFGSVFAQWLRNKIMVARNWFHPDSVYVDNVSMRLREGTSIEVDDRFQKADGVLYAGARNANWDESYRAAMAQADTMIFVVTTMWSGSKWCLQELHQFQQENARRVQQGRAPLQGIVLLIESESGQRLASLRPFQMSGVPNLEYRTVKKAFAAGFSFGKHGADGKRPDGDRCSWIIGDGDLQAVLSKVPPS